MGNQINVNGCLDEEALKRYLEGRFDEAIAALGTCERGLDDSNVEEVVRGLVRHFRIDPVSIDWQGWSVSEPSLAEDLDHIPIRKTDIVNHRVSIPFTGESAALSILGKSKTKATPPFGGDVPLGFVENGFFKINLSIKHGVAKFATVFRKRKELIEATLRQLNSQLSKFNHRLEGAIERETVKMQGLRRDALSAYAELGIPLVSREGEPDFTKVPLKRKLVVPLALGESTGVAPEPGISSDDYEHILGVIRHAGRTFEAAPRTFSVHDETGLRDIVLANLSGHYHQLPTGETFRKKGKTDIRIESEERSAFVAECKVWRGGATLSKAIDQLLGYLTWRDCKASIVVFNKNNARFRSILRKVPALLTEQPRFRNIEDKSAEGEWRCRFASRKDSKHVVAVHVFMFNIFVEDSERRTFASSRRRKRRH